jgi:hypothetical protein
MRSWKHVIPLWVQWVLLGVILGALVVYASVLEVLRVYPVSLGLLHSWSILCVVAACFGVALVAASPLVDRSFGEEGVATTLGVSVALHVLAGSSGAGICMTVFHEGHTGFDVVVWGGLSTVICGISLVWLGLSYLMFITSPRPKVRGGPKERHCVPVLIHGTEHQNDDEIRRRLSSMEWNFWTYPSNCVLEAGAWVWGRRFFGYWRPTWEVELNVAVGIVCRSGSDGYKATADPQGATWKEDGLVSAEIDNSIICDGDEVTCSTSMKALLRTGGTQVTIGGTGGALAPSVPGIQVTMGSYRWRCEAESVKK